MPPKKDQAAAAAAAVEKLIYAGLEVENADTPARTQDYVYIHDLRLVLPYYFDFKCHVKQRHEGKNVIELFSEEFPMLTESYYRSAWAAGKLRVEGQKEWPIDRPLRAGMCLRHFLHRHEPPVLAASVQVVGENTDFVAVNKPACLPVHAVGQYRKNTVMGLIQAERPDLWPLYPTHRLDKPVSGLLLLARSGAAANRMRDHLEERSCQKVYVARVQGIFPSIGSSSGNSVASASQPAADADAGSGSTGGCAVGSKSNAEVIVVKAPLTWDAKHNHATALPEDCADQQLLADAKHAETHFRLLSVSPDGKTSVVEAQPKTGRTHQIRVHLQHLGHPIANDTQYGGTYGLPLYFRRGNDGLREPHVIKGHAQKAMATGEAPAGSTHASTSAGAGAGAGGGGGGAHEAGDGNTADAKRPRLASADESGTVQVQLHQAGAFGGGDSGGAGTAAGAGAGAGGEACASGPGRPRNAATTGGAAGGASFAPSASPAATAAGPSSETAADDVASMTYNVLYNDPRFRVPDGKRDDVCVHCPCLVPEGYPIDLEPLWLHARQYRAADWCFEAPLPEWAGEDYVAMHARERYALRWEAK